MLRCSGRSSAPTGGSCSPRAWTTSCSCGGCATGGPPARRAATSPPPKASNAPPLYSPAPNVFDASLSPDGRRFALTSVVGVDIVGAATLRRERTIALAGELPTSAQFSRDGRLLVVAGFKRWARAYSTRTWRPVTRDLRGHTGEVRSASVSPDGRTLATGSGDGTVRLFDLRTGQP